MRKHFTVLSLCIVGFWGQLVAQGTVAGQIIDESGQPVANVSIVVEGLNTGAYSNLKGEFKIENIDQEQVRLAISHISYSPQYQDLILPMASPITIILKSASFYVDQVVVEATRADFDTPTTYVNISGEELQKNNFGQDIPVLLEYTPSVVSTSDAGAGIGYTGIRIRGTDMTRINVTINGVPLNDSESHGVFWVNTPDLASSTGSIQIQRGVGTSTNGAASFGATINLLTDQYEEEPYALISTAAGSFNSLKNTIQYGTGLLNKSWSFGGRLSSVRSDGYIDRSSSDLKSYFLSGLYKGKSTIARFLVFGGLEETYQSWWGTPEARLDNDVEGMNTVAANNGYTQAQTNNLLNSGRTFNYYLYENEIDHYQQDHYQAHLGQQISPGLSFSTALHYTYGRGYFEQFKDDEDFSDYDIEPITTDTGTISSTDLIRRRWLANHFYGVTYSLNYSREKVDVILGGSKNTYLGDHFGEVIWAQFSPNLPVRYRYYDNSAKKSDFTSYAKIVVHPTEKLSLFGDLQLRSVHYTAEGPDADRIAGVPVQINLDQKFNFFNPKVGISFSPDTFKKVYLSYAVANREPVRSDFIDNQNGQVPTSEVLRNIEFGTSLNTGKSALKLNLYYMNYRNQLVLTGAVNDVGSSLRTNVDKSYRVGIEAEATSLLTEWLSLNINATVSSNKIDEFSEVLYDYGANWDEYNEVINVYRNTDLAFSPSMIAASELSFFPTHDYELAILFKYVGSQFLDNTSNVDRSIDAYFLGNLRASYLLKVKGLKQLKVGILVNNLFNTMYESNGYTFGYQGGGAEIRENYFYPQAGTNFMLSMDIKF